MAERSLDPEQIERFRRDGFLVVEDVFGPRELESFARAVDAAVASRTESDARPLEEKTLYEQSFVQCMNLWEDNLDVRQWTFDPRVGEMAARLLDASAVRIWHDQALYKEAGGRVTDPHQDRPFWPIRPADQITAWIAFDGSRRGRGAMAYVPGSHRVGLERFVDISHVFQEPYDILADPKIAEIEARWVEVEPGSVVFHHSLTVHLAEANSSRDTRRVYCIIYFADGCVRTSDFPHVTLDRQHIAVGEAIRGEVSPIVWPRPSGTLPGTPSGRPPRVGFR